MFPNRQEGTRGGLLDALLLGGHRAGVSCPEGEKSCLRCLLPVFRTGNEHTGLRWVQDG